MNYKKPSARISSPVKGGSLHCSFHGSSDPPYATPSGEPAPTGGVVMPGVPLGDPSVGSETVSARSLTNPWKKVACRASGKTKNKHRGCFPGGDAIQRLPSAPFWIDPDPCPALRDFERRARRRQKEKTKGKASKEGRDVKSSACARSDELRRKALKIVRLLEVEQGLKAEKPLPSALVCGSLRASVRSMYATGLTQCQLLSIKTSVLAESQPCCYCETLQLSDKMEKYEKARYQTVEVDAKHLRSFTKAFAENVPTGWNKRAEQFPYVPNGAASLDNSKREGGNWNESSFSTACRATSVFTKGKWRTVTMYSSHNVEVLTPLHNSLYSYLQRRSWLLVGCPTEEKLIHLQDGCVGKSWLSFDYESATDNIKTAYVQAAVDVLISKGVELSDDEIRCLLVLGRLDLGEGVAESGQPMGSPMSFPVLCLINKTVVDLALSALLTEGKISFKEWTSHRCLINGDDLLTKDVSSGGLAESIFSQGRFVGLRSNWDKTLADPEIGEINSTVFKNCVLQKKTNVSALWMAAEVTDVIAFAREATVTKRGFLSVVRNNVSRLARQKIKTSIRLPLELCKVLLSCRPIQKALLARPASSAPKDTNLFPVVTMPDGYELSKQEEGEAIRQRIRVVREKELFVNIPSEKKRNRNIRKEIPIVHQEGRVRRGLLAILKPKKPRSERTVLSVLADRWKEKRKEDLLAVDGSDVSYTYPTDLSGIEFMLDSIKLFKDKRNKSQAHNTSALNGIQFSKGIGYVSLTDDT